MKITYINHSGFLIETTGCYYLFDYYKGELPPLDARKPILVFASHMHPDHYNPTIFKMLTERGMKQVTAVLSKDIPNKKYPLDVAMLPLDPRQEKDYHRGMLYFLQKINTKKAFPMHYWEKPEVIQQFIKAYPEYKAIVQNTESFAFC